MKTTVTVSDNIRPILGALRSVPVPPARVEGEPAAPVQPFVTISREPGGGGWTLANQLVDRLNELSPGEQPWTCWERELIEKVATDLHLSTRLIDSLEDHGHSWMGDFLGSLSFSDDAARADEAKVYARVAQTIRALALAGRVVIVGRGGIFITRKMPGGIHIRLIAPFEKRVEFMSREYNVSPEKAAARVRELERNRQSFYRHYWPNESLWPETFSVTINTAEVSQEAMVEMVSALVRSRMPAAIG